jgi:hypothetical protein
MSLQDELRKAVAANDTPRVQTLADQIARNHIERFQRKLDAIMLGGTGYRTPHPPCGCRIVHTCNNVT